MPQQTESGYVLAVSIIQLSSVQTAVPRSLKVQEALSVISVDGHRHRERLHLSSALIAAIYLMKTTRSDYFRNL